MRFGVGWRRWYREAPHSSTYVCSVEGSARARAPRRHRGCRHARPNRDCYSSARSDTARVGPADGSGSNSSYLEDDAVVNARSDGMAVSRSGFELIFRGDAQGHLVQPWKSGALGQLYAVNFPCW